MRRSVFIDSTTQAGLILLTGASGQVGGALLPLLRRFGEVIAPTRGELDLSDADAVRAFVRQTVPRWIVNPAAYTAVDKAESEPALAHTINAAAPEALGVEAARLGAPVIHFSTDYVFDGSGTTPWTETDPTGPLGVYGNTKLAGEQALAATGAAHAILRTSWVYAPRGKNFLLTILRLAREREELRVVADQHGAPTSAGDLARLVAHIIAQTEGIAAAEGCTIAEALRGRQGVYHAANAGESTWFGFAEEFVGLASKAEPEQRFAKLVPITTAEYPTPARRPMNSRLDCTRLAREFGFTMPRWQDAVTNVMTEHLSASTS